MTFVLRLTAARSAVRSRTSRRNFRRSRYDGRVRRIAGCILNAFTILSLLLCVATVGLWVRSYYHKDVLVRAIQDGYLLHFVGSNDHRSGEWYVAWARQWPGPPVFWHGGAFDFNMPAINYHLSRASEISHRWPLGFESGSYDERVLFRTRGPVATRAEVEEAIAQRFFGLLGGRTADMPGKWLRGPYWALVVATALLPVTRGTRRAWRMLGGTMRAHRRLTRHGLCPACGYDLRATPDRCPECGTLPEKVEA
jgi:hypothetical protein